jgi:hypothetical protein
MTLKTPERDLPSWLEVSEAKGKLSVRMVGRWGHARVLPQAEIKDGQLRFTSPKEEEGRPDDMVFEARRTGDGLTGSTRGPDGRLWTWQAERAPSLKRKSAPQWGQPVALFTGQDMSAWRSSDAGAKTQWKVVDGVLVSPGAGPDLITNASFEDFRLHLEFRCDPHANSGVYLRGRYEVQIEDDAEPEAPSMRTGGVYGHLAPTTVQRCTPGSWHRYDITLVGRTVTVVLNGKTIIDHREIPGITGGALDSHEASPGPIYLQGSEDGHVAFRNIVLTPAKAMAGQEKLHEPGI